MGELSFLHTTLGIIANQQTDVARLICEAHRLGIKVIAYAHGNNLAVRDADVIIVGQLNDKAKLKEFATQCQIVMYMNGSRINGSVLNYLRQFTNVPQGTHSLDLVNDRSIQRVFLDMINVKSLPYDTVFSADDVKQIMNTLQGPILLRPVQTSYFQQPDVIITNADQLPSYKSMFNGEAYLVEALPSKARYFKVTVMKSRSGIVTLPIIEEHYKGQRLDFANVISHGSVNLNDRFKAITSRVANHINYVGLLTFSVILTHDDQVYIDGIDSSFNLVNNVYNLTPDNVYQMFLRLIMGAPVRARQSNYSWSIKVVNQNNLAQLEKLLNNDGDVRLNLSSLVNRTDSNGYALISAPTSTDSKAGAQAK